MCDFDVVGVTEDISIFFVLLAMSLGCPVVDFTYSSIRVEVGRPSISDAPQGLQLHLHDMLKSSGELALHQLARQRMLTLARDKFRDTFDSELQHYNSLQKQREVAPGTNCTFTADTQKLASKVNRKGSAKDCFRLVTGTE